MKNRGLFIVVAMLVLIGLIGVVACNRVSGDEPVDRAEQDNEFDILLENITSGGPGKDGIPPIEEPVYNSIQEADEYLADTDKVFVFQSGESVFIYPQRILVWHEIVNELIDGKEVSITYCPLTGSAIAYLGENERFSSNTYGTSGKLLNSNLVMYDRASDSYIPQILGFGISGALAGQRLETQPIHWADWADVKATYTEARILSTETGFLRDYFSDPYGSYDPDDAESYYYTGSPLFPVMYESEDVFSDKYVVVGIKHKDAVVALDPSVVEVQQVLSFELAAEEVVAFYDSQLKTVRVFRASIGDETLIFESMEQGIFDQRGIRWYANGISERSEELMPLTYFDVMWFAWHAFYPESEVIR